MEKITIDPKQETTPKEYAAFKGITKQAINNWLYRDNKLVFRRIPTFNLILIQIPEEELEEWENYLNAK